ncbi:MAG: hypothetical protein ACJZ2N_03465, partial [Candidatus Poseidoniales archaeon]
TYDSATLFVDESQLKEANVIIPKWSIINLSVVVNNPTDLNFNNLYLDLEVNNQQAFARTSFKLLSNTTLRENVTWPASVEGPLSLRISTKLVDYSDNITDYTITLSKFIEVESTNISEEESSGAWGALFAIIILLFLCSYIIYNDVETAEAKSNSGDVFNDSDHDGDDEESSGHNEEE